MGQINPSAPNGVNNLIDAAETVWSKMTRRSCHLTMIAVMSIHIIIAVLFLEIFFQMSNTLATTMKKSFQEHQSFRDSFDNFGQRGKVEGDLQKPFMRP